MKKYFVKTHVIEQAERMAEKYNYLAYKQEWKMEDNILDEEQFDECEKKIQEYREKETKIREALFACMDGSCYRGYWKDIEILKEAGQERDILDSCILTK